MENKNLHEQIAGLLNELTEEQKAKVKTCKTSKEFIKVIEEEGIELPDDALETVAGGVSMDEFLMAVFAREWEIEQREHIDMYDFEGQHKAYDRAFEEILKELGSPD